MSGKVLGLIVAAAVVVGSVAPASAEFFGCNEPRTKVSYSSGYRAFAQAPQSSRRTISQPSQRRYASQQHTSFWH